MKVFYHFPIIVCSVFVVRIPGGGGQHATLYEHTGRGGRYLRVKAEKHNCITLPSKWQERASSLDTHGACLLMYENSDCTGNYLRVRPSSSTYIPNLKKTNFNDLISSIRTCEPNRPLGSGRYAIQNVEDKMYLTARHVVKGYTMVETEKWTKKISQQWDVWKNRDGTYWLIPRVHVSKNKLTYEMRKKKKEDFPEIGMFKERVYWVLDNIRGNKYMIKNDDTGNCLTRPEDSEIEEDECDRDSKEQQWLFYRVV